MKQGGQLHKAAPEAFPAASRAFPLMAMGDRLFRWLTAVAALLVPAVILAMGVDLFISSYPALAKFGPGFLISQEWNPVTQEFGAASSIFGTLMSTLIAMLIALPLSLAIALFLVELALPG